MGRGNDLDRGKSTPQDVYYEAKTTVDSIKRKCPEALVIIGSIPARYQRSQHTGKFRRYEEKRMAANRMLYQLHIDEKKVHCLDLASELLGDPRLMAKYDTSVKSAGNPSRQSLAGTYLMAAQTRWPKHKIPVRDKIRVSLQIYTNCSETGRGRG